MKNIAKLLLIPTVTTLIVGIFITLGWFYSWHLKLSNFLFSYDEPRHTSDVVVVKIDEKSLLPQDQGGLGRWQDWKRSYYATVLQNLRAAGSKVIGIDVFFSEPYGESQAGDLTNVLADMLHLEEAKQIVYETIYKHDQELKSSIGSDIVMASLFDKTNNKIIYPNTSVFSEESGAKLGNILMKEDVDNVIRSTPMIFEDESTPYSFALTIVSIFLNTDISVAKDSITILNDTIKSISNGKNYGPIIIPIDEANSMKVNFFGRPQSIPSISFSDVYYNNFSKADVENKIVLIGEMDAGLHDDVYTPVSFGMSMPGVELHANAIETILTSAFITEQSKSAQMVMIFLLSLLLTYFFYRLRPVWATLLLIGALLAYVVAAFIIFWNYSYIVNFWYPIFAFIITYILTIVAKYLLEERSKKYITRAFSHYISDALVDKIVEDPSLVSLGGEKKELSVLFTDIAGFTTLSEKLPPEELVEFLHVYLDHMTEIIMKNNGTLDKYIGDAIMAFWGAPLELKDHAVQSCKSALEMHKKLATILQPWKHDPLFATMHIRTGIATGEMVVGNIGAKRRFDYTVIGDTVNLAARLEGVNKVYHTSICVGEKTYAAAKELFSFRVLDRIRVKGKEEPITIYELVEEKGKTSDELATFIQSFENAYHAYQAKDFRKALKILESLRTSHYYDDVVDIYLERCQTYLDVPPQGDWDGVFEMKTK